MPGAVVVAGTVTEAGAAVLATGATAAGMAAPDCCSIGAVCMASDPEPVAGVPASVLP